MGFILMMMMVALVVEMCFILVPVAIQNGKFVCAIFRCALIGVPANGI